jgi:hypothetical protein
MSLMKYLAGKVGNQELKPMDWLRMTLPSFWEGVSRIYNLDTNLEVDLCPKCVQKLDDSEGIEMDFQAFNRSIKKAINEYGH